MSITDTNIVTLESLVDSIGLVETVRALSEICFAKVSHLEENWQEPSTSLDLKTWKHNAQYLDGVSARIWRQSYERKGE
jgi:hypothetical protein